MSNIDKRETELLIENGVLVADTLRHLADNEIDSDYFAICHTNENGTEIECELAITDYARQAAGVVDELANALEAAGKQIAELSHHLQSAHAFIEHTEAFGYEASSGILCCGDAQWNIDESKSALAAAGKGEAS